MTKVLVIEDDAPIRENLCELLEAEGFEPVAASNGRLGVDAARRHAPDLILCDIMMPELDGYGVLEQLRQDPATATIPVVFLSAKADKAAVRRGMELGADDYITKPFTRAEVLSSIAARLDRQANIDREYRERLDELRSSVALSLPHEVRTPLTGIVTGVQLLRERLDSLSRHDILLLLDIMDASTKRLQRLVTNYLLYAGLEFALSEQGEPDSTEGVRTNVCEIVTSAAKAQADDAGRPDDLTLNLAVAEVAVSAEFMLKITEELVDNAFRYSEPGTPVKVTGVPCDGRYVLEIEDAGRGMAPGEVSRVGAYMQFGRRLHEQQGTGLGLVVARQLAELHGGELRLTSAPGGGTTVRVELPEA